MSTWPARLQETKWADVAAAVGIGSTALYHYFESKQHCLYEIMGQALDSSTPASKRIAAEHDDWTEALLAVLHDAFDLTEHEVLRHRVLVAQLGTLAAHRRSRVRKRRAPRARSRAPSSSPGARSSRAACNRALIPENDPRLLARALLGLYNSVWHWYRTGDGLTLPELGGFVVERQLALLGSSARAELLAEN